MLCCLEWCCTVVRYHKGREGSVTTVLGDPQKGSNAAAEPLPEAGVQGPPWVFGLHHRPPGFGAVRVVASVRFFSSH